MPDFDWKSAVRAVAPGIATALGGPAAGLAVATLGRILLGNEDASEADIAAKIAESGMSGDQILAMKKADQDFQMEMAKIAQVEDAAVLADVQDARRRQIETKDNMPQVIFFVLMAVYIAENVLFWFFPMPTDDYLKGLIVRSFGTIETGLVGAIAYFIGSSRGSKRSADAVRAVAMAKAG